MNDSLSHKEFSVRYNRVMIILDKHLITKGEIESLLAELEKDMAKLIKYDLNEKIDERADKRIDERLYEITSETEHNLVNSIPKKSFWWMITAMLIFKFFDLMFQLY